MFKRIKELIVSVIQIQQNYDIKLCLIYLFISIFFVSLSFININSYKKQKKHLNNNNNKNKLFIYFLCMYVCNVFNEDEGQGEEYSLSGCCNQQGYDHLQVAYLQR